MLLGWSSSDGDDGFDGVGGGMPGVTSHVGGAGGVTGGSGGGADRTFISRAGGGVGGNSGGARIPALYVTAQPSTRCFNGFARPVIVRVPLLKKRKHMLRAISSPKRK